MGAGYLNAPLSEIDDTSLKDLKEEIGAAGKLGLHADFLDKISVFGVPGIRFPHQAIFHPRKYLAALLAAIGGDGSHVFENAPADEILEKSLAVKSGKHKMLAASRDDNFLGVAFRERRR